MKIRDIAETATAGSIASVANSHLSPGKARGQKSYTEIDFSNEVGKLSQSDEEILSGSIKSGTIGSREVYLFKNGSDRIYFFARDEKIDALLYLHQDRLMGMRNFSDNKGLIYNLFQYIVGMLKQKIKLSAVDKLTPDGIKWIVKQSTLSTGFTITDGKGKPIDAKKLYAEWEQARTSGRPGPTEIVIKESKIGMKLRENENRLMPMDIFGATMRTNSTEYMNNLYEDMAEGEQDLGPDYQDRVKRLGQMARQGPRKTVWDPVKQVYKTVPVNEPKDQTNGNAIAESYNRLRNQI